MGNSAEMYEISNWRAEHYKRFDAASLGTLPTANRWLEDRLLATLSEGIEIGRRLQKAEDQAKLAKVLS